MISKGKPENIMLTSVIRWIRASTQPPYHVPTAAIAIVVTVAPTAPIKPIARAMGVPHNRATVKSPAAMVRARQPVQPAIADEFQVNLGIRSNTSASATSS